LRDNIIMIGLQRPAQQALNNNEPPAIRGLSKHQLYLLLCETYMLPSIDSKGINRTYLVGVYSERNFRVPLLDYKRFEAELTPQQQKKTNLVNLLREKGRHPLGFPTFVIPEEAWLCKVARFVDRKNVMEFFGAELEPLQPVTIDSERVHQGRLAAHRYIFHNNNLLDNPRIFSCVKEISESYRKIISRRIDLEDAENTINLLRDRITEEEGQMKSALVKTATTIISIANDNFNPEEIYIEEDDRGNGQAHRQQLGEMTRLYTTSYLG
jgi:hypothetical protein